MEILNQFHNMYYKEYTPSKSLQQYIECYWIVDIQHSVLNFEFLPPNLTTELVFCLNNPFYYNIKNITELSPCIHILSSRQSGIKIHLEPFSKILGIRFKPGMIKYLLGPEVLKSPDHVINAIEYDSHFKFLYHQLLEYSEINKILYTLESYLSSRSYGIPLQELETSKWIEQVYNTPSLSINYFSNHIFNSCTRNMQIRMKNLLNVSPSEVKKLGLFNFIIKNVNDTNKTKLIDIALKCGFYDQAHFNRFFKKIANQSPKKFFDSNKYVIKTATNSNVVNVE